MNCKAIATILTLTLVAGVVWAQDDVMGLYFSESEFTLDTAQTTVSPSFLMSAYIVLTNPTGATITGYEVGISSTAPDFAVPLTSLTFDTNLGTNTNQIVTFLSPKPVVATGTVLATVFLATDSTDYEEISFGPSDPSSLPGGVPVVYYGAGDLTPCNSPFAGPVVAWLNGVPVANQQVSWDGVRMLFR